MPQNSKWTSRVSNPRSHTLKFQRFRSRSGIFHSRTTSPNQQGGADYSEPGIASSSLLSTMNPVANSAPQKPQQRMYEAATGKWSHLLFRRGSPEQLKTNSSSGKCNVLSRPHPHLPLNRILQKPQIGSARACWPPWLNYPPHTTPVSYRNRNHSWRGSASASAYACCCSSLSEPRPDR